ncbi:TetR family transcriptional regulator [Streptomyces roseoverticillatus]|uniref:TetR/AcrR family transcriptional regulator n=1 Tax=Streptomyces roseoverticillatus TaxID=66429 RepID=UPI001F3A4F96|nr:TetR/AcrR family transcriptional regulator [Streptomyces roseoverticillatus]MCF3101604.1 TetR family transcriptional regulator [Streptomyces roseoverticillatus]
MPPEKPSAPAPSPRTALIADTALALIAERGMRGLTHRAVDEAAGLPPGSTSNHARTRLALLELTVRQLARRDAEVLTPAEFPGPAEGLDALADAIATVLHRLVVRRREHTVARFELALEASRRPELRAIYDAAGQGFRDLMTELMAAAGSAEPQRHALSLGAWSDGVLFTCTAGPYHDRAPAREELRESVGELLRGMLAGCAVDGKTRGDDGGRAGR